jgi:hypothetical protein
VGLLGFSPSVKVSRTAARRPERTSHTFSCLAVHTQFLQEDALWKKKGLQQNRPAYFYFVDLEKAFRKLELKTVLDILGRNNVPNGLVILIIYIIYIYIHK